MGLFAPQKGLKHYHLKCTKHLYRWSAFERVWSELLKKDQSGHTNLWKASNYDLQRIWLARKPVSNYMLKYNACVCPWERYNTWEIRTKNISTRLEYIKLFTYSERKKKWPNFYGIFSQTPHIFTAFTAILKITLPQCNAIGVRTPPGSILRKREGTQKLCSVSTMELQTK